MLDFNPQVGREQAGRRPALVLSPAYYNGRSGLCVVCPITNQSKGYTYEVPLPPGGKVTGVALADHIKNLDWRGRAAKRLATAPAAFVQEVLEKTLTLLNPEDS
jgi:mRNA interferase MazF